jgi:acyl-CoA thioester hydrolase
MEPSSNSAKDRTTMSDEQHALESLASYDAVLSFKMSWGDMDAFGHVNNATYFRYFEDARINWFEAAGLMDGSEWSGEVAPVLASTSCKFRRPLVYPESLAAGTCVSEVGTYRFVLEHAVAIVDDDVVAAHGEAEIVPFHHKNGHKVEIPDRWRRALQETPST